MPKRGREFWNQLIREYEAGDGRESHGEFAYRRRVKVATFRLWLYRLRAERKKSPRLVPVRVVASTTPTARGKEEGLVELELPGGLRRRFLVGTDGAYLAALAERLIG